MTDQMALKALETLNSGDTYKTHNAATALRQALDQEKPPVKSYCGGKPNYCTEPEDWVPLYTAKQVAEAVEAAIKSRQWVGLTDEEISEYLWMGRDVVSVIKEVQETLKEKNTWQK